VASLLCIILIYFLLESIHLVNMRVIILSGLAFALLVLPFLKVEYFLGSFWTEKGDGVYGV
jgi:hypothetical protein